MAAEGEASAAGAVPPEDDEEVVIEELDGSGQPLEEAASTAPGEAKDEEDEEDDKPPDDEVDAAMWRVEKEKKKMTAAQKLERAGLWKAKGNECFKQADLFKAADAYYHAIVFCRELMNNPQYYPKLNHTVEQRKAAQDLCESTFTNLALVQYKYAMALPQENAERRKTLEEAGKSASEALKVNAKNVKALFRRAQAKSGLVAGMENEEAQQLLGEAKADLMAIIAEDAQNRDARAELRSVQERLKALRREELNSEKKNFAFGSTLSALVAKEQDLLGDGSVRKRLTTAGDGGNWMNEDWLIKDAPVRCVAHVRVAMLSSGGADGTEDQHSLAPVTISFVLGDSDMHEGIDVAVRSMTVGEVSRFTIVPTRMAAKGTLANLMPSPKEQASVWEITFVKFVTWTDLERDGCILQKVGQEGYGRFADALAEVSMHWRVFGPDGGLVHSSRYTVSIGENGEGMKQVEDEDKAPPCYTIGEECWEPLDILCKSLRQGGVGELRMKRLPKLPEESDDKGDGAAAKLSRMMNMKTLGQEWQHCTVRAEVLRVVQPLAGPSDPRWEGEATLVQERMRAEHLAERGDELAALTRLRRILSWAPQLLAAENSDAACRQLAFARASAGWLLASRAQPILDSGNVSSAKLSEAQRELDEAKDLCLLLQREHPELAGTRLLTAKIAIVQDDDFDRAHTELVEAQRLSPDDKRVQEELKRAKAELRRISAEESRAKVIEIRDGLKRARVEAPDAAAVLAFLQELDKTRIPWETVMETRIGVELKACQEGFGNDVQQLSAQILGRLMDESKEQRPMWEG